MTPIETKLFIETVKKIEALDEKAGEHMASGAIIDFAEYRQWAGYRKALADCLTLFRETNEDVMKE